MGTVAKEFIKNIKLKDKEILICDSEAGIEHFGRGVDSAVDTILMILDPSFESLELSSKIYKMSKDINKNIHFIINKADEQQYEIIKEKITDKSAIVGYINNNKDILMSGLQGDPIKYSGNEIKNIINKLS
jgi:CO dehydrogenase maturation factor